MVELVNGNQKNIEVTSPPAAAEAGTATVEQSAAPQVESVPSVENPAGVPYGHKGLGSSLTASWLSIGEPDPIELTENVSDNDAFKTRSDIVKVLNDNVKFLRYSLGSINRELETNDKAGDLRFAGSLDVTLDKDGKLINATFKITINNHHEFDERIKGLVETFAQKLEFSAPRVNGTVIYKGYPISGNSW